MCYRYMKVINEIFDFEESYFVLICDICVIQVGVDTYVRCIE